MPTETGGAPVAAIDLLEEAGRAALGDEVLSERRYSSPSSAAAASSSFSASTS